MRLLMRGLDVQMRTRACLAIILQGETGCPTHRSSLKKRRFFQTRSVPAHGAAAARKRRQ
jgi:hypothetical protein